MLRAGKASLSGESDPRLFSEEYKQGTARANSSSRGISWTFGYPRACLTIIVPMSTGLDPVEIAKLRSFSGHK